MKILKGIRGLDEPMFWHKLDLSFRNIHLYGNSHDNYPKYQENHQLYGISPSKIAKYAKIANFN